MVINLKVSDIELSIKSTVEGSDMGLVKESVSQWTFQNFIIREFNVINTSDMTSLNYMLTCQLRTLFTDKFQLLNKTFQPYEHQLQDDLNVHPLDLSKSKMNNLSLTIIITRLHLINFTWPFDRLLWNIIRLQHTHYSIVCLLTWSMRVYNR